MNAIINHTVNQIVQIVASGGGIDEVKQLGAELSKKLYRDGLASTPEQSNEIATFVFNAAFEIVKRM
jgi:hypothetical protein